VHAQAEVSTRREDRWWGFTWLSMSAALALVGVSLWVVPAQAAGGGSASAQAAKVDLAGAGDANGQSVGLGLSGATPVVTAPASPGTSSSNAGLNLAGLGSSSGISVVSTTATRTTSGTAAQSKVDHATVSGFGTSLLTASDISSSVSCPADGTPSAQTSANNVSAGGTPINAATGGSASIPVNVLGLGGASVIAAVNSPQSTSASGASATGLRVSFTLQATVPVIGTSLSVPLGTFTLAHSECVSPTGGTTDSTIGPTTGPTTGTSGGPTTGPNPSDSATGGPSGSTSTSTQPADVPNIVVIVPDQGPTAGGQQVTINGSRFVPGAIVTFGGAPATSVTVSPTGTAISAVTPAGTAGPADVVVTQPAGDARLVNGYTYVPPGAPIIDLVNPSSGPTSGGQTVTITGEGFTADTTVMVEGVALTATVMGPDALTVVMPAHSAGTVAVVLGNSYGKSGARPYTFVPDAAACSDGGFSNSSLIGYTGLGVGAAAILGLIVLAAFKGTGFLHLGRIRT
jgi:hypothetical protein